MSKWEQLMMDISDGKQDIDLADFQRRMGLSDGWDWSDVECMINDGRTSSADVEDAIRAGLR